MIRRLWLTALLLLALTAAPAAAHEVRPALLMIAEHAAGDYDVTWKRPLVGDMGLRLSPHLSGGALEKPPTVEQVSPGFEIRRWQVRGGPPLDGQTLQVDGLAQTVTDVVVRVSTHDGRALDFVLRPSAPSVRLALSGPQGIAVPGYLRLGVEHILTGFDHLLFVLGLLLLVGPGWRLVKTVTAFTVAHSITLALAALGYQRLPSATIEALVALSILFVAVELARPAGGPQTLTRRSPWLIAFTFGLLHGMAFAGALAQIGLPPGAAPQALLLFNLGVEAGQLIFIGAVLALAALWRVMAPRQAWMASPWLRRAPAYAIGGLSAWWLVERTLAAVTAA
jgi:hydrogenase/urease accessory protein HupE